MNYNLLRDRVWLISNTEIVKRILGKPIFYKLTPDDYIHAAVLFESYYVPEFRMDFIGEGDQS
jgi:Cu2+-containing amine oxidase